MDRNNFLVIIILMKIQSFLQNRPTRIYILIKYYQLIFAIKSTINWCWTMINENIVKNTIRCTNSQRVIQVEINHRDLHQAKKSSCCFRTFICITLPMKGRAKLFHPEKVVASVCSGWWLFTEFSFLIIFIYLCYNQIIISRNLHIKV